jgi:type VI secretion system VasD/TssJ family lipoprotein
MRVYSRISRSIAYWLVAVFAGLALSGCGLFGGPKVNTGDREKLPTPLEITLGALEDVNPTTTGRPSPIVMRVFELANDSRFQTADYFELMGQGAVSLEGDVLSSEEHTLLPGEVRVVRKRAMLGSKFLGVVAGYRDLGSSTWRAVVPLPEPYLAGRLWTHSVSPTKRLFIVLDKSSVVIKEDEPSGK